MLNEDDIFFVTGSGIFVAILIYLIIYIYNKYNNKIEKWRAGILFADYIFIAIIINSIITALMPSFTSLIILNSNIIIATIISIVIYGVINAFICITSKELNKKGRKFLLHFAVILLIFTILSILGLKGINILHLCFIILIIFNFYYYKILDLKEIKSTKAISKSKISNINKKQDITKKFSNETNNNQNSKTFYVILIMIFAVTAVIFCVLVFVFINKYNNIYSEYQSVEEELNKVQEESDENLFKALEYKEKADFLDDNIVFVLDGYGKVYYTYDCVKKITNYNQYSYWAYNKSAAISLGYKEAKC